MYELYRLYEYHPEGEGAHSSCLSRAPELLWHVVSQISGPRAALQGQAKLGRPRVLLESA